jgi:hypothetical protein
MTLVWLKDTIERTVATYVEVLIGLLIAGWTDHIDWSFAKTAAVAAVPAALAVAKAALAELRPGTVSPASLTKP